MTSESNVSLTKHAVDRIMSRFNVKNRNAAVRFVNKHFAQAAFITTVANENGVENRMFVAGDIVFIVEARRDHVITVYKADSYNGPATQAMRSKVSTFVRAEIDAIKATAQRSERKFSRTQAELQLELAERKLELLRARAPHRKLALQARINALQARANDMGAEIHGVKRECTKSINGAVAYV
jgi:hypothetical protein